MSVPVKSKHSAVDRLPLNQLVSAAHAYISHESPLPERDPVSRSTQI